MARAAGMLALIVALGTPAQAAPRASAAPDPHEAFRALQRRAGAPLQVRWDADLPSATFLSAQGQGRLPSAAPTASAATPEAAARAFLDQNRQIFGIADVASELDLLRIEPDPHLGWYHLRFDQRYHGLPVFGRQLVVHLDAQLRPVTVNGHVFPGLDVPTESAITAADAAATALRDLREVQLKPAEQLGMRATVLDDKTELMVYVDQNNKPRLAWSVRILTEQPLGEWQYFVGASRPWVIHAFDRLNQGKRRVTYTAGNSTRLPGRKLIDEGERSKDAIAQAAHDNAGKTYDYYFNTFKRDSIDGQGMAIVSTVHYGRSSEDSENAAWVSELRQMIYGDGGEIFKPLAYGLDVVAHELTHGVTDATAQLVYEGQSGALNESYSDVMATMIDSANWTLGEQVVNSPPYPAAVLRDLEDPTLGGQYDPRDPLSAVGQPATLDDYANLPLNRSYDNGGVHVNSGIPNHAAFLVAQALGRDKAGAIYYRTLTEYLTPSSDFSDHATATVRAAQDLYGEADAQAVAQAFAQVGIDTGGGEQLPAPPADTSTVPNIPAQPDQEEPIPQGCTEGLVNGGFESNEAWVEATAGDFSLIDPELPRSGERSVWLGGTDQEPLQLIYQELSIPPNASSVQLSYWRLIHQEYSGLGGLLSNDSVFSAVVLNSGGDVLGAIEQQPSSEGDDEWKQAQFDLSAFAGKTIRLTFTVENTRGNLSSFFVDDVSLAVCTAGTGGSAPAPSSADEVFIEGNVQNADTGRAVSGAQVFIIRPELSASQVADDGEVSDDEVLTSAVSDDDGYFRTDSSVPRGKTYSVIVLAGGYRSIVSDDGVEITSDDPNPVQIDIAMRRGRG
ncbi:hypothetical protein F8S13_23985 [Chloroflexia bacterium SDU3-3]|nr:hypothetical protein F8S13_23985 [Chloroflexia bacterium SDU3-3]